MADDVAKPRPGSSDYRWQTASGGQPGPAGSRRRRWIITLAAPFLSFASIPVASVLLIQFRTKPPFFRSISIGSYTSKQLPVIPFAERDGELLRRHFPGGMLPQAKSADLLRSQLAELAKLSTREHSTVVIHLNALAVARND